MNVLVGQGILLTIRIKLISFWRKDENFANIACTSTFTIFVLDV